MKLIGLFAAHFAKLPADEFYKLHPARRRGFADRLLIIPNEWLLRQHVLSIEVSHPAFDHFLDDVFRLPFFAGLLAENGAFFVD